MRQKHHPSGLLQLALHVVFGIAPLLSLFVVALPGFAQSPVPTLTSLSVTQEGLGAVLTATVRTASGSAANSGTVDFLLRSGQSLGSAIVTANGTATLGLPKLPDAEADPLSRAPEFPVVAVYQACNDAYADSHSVAAEVSTPAATQAPDFSVTANPTTVTVAQGAYGSTAITITSLAGYAGAIEFSCSNLPAQVTCAFNPTQQALTANSSFITTLELQTQAASGTASSALFPASEVALAVLVPGGLVLFGLAGRGRRAFRGAQWLGAFLLLLGAGAGLSGCSARYGYLHHPPPVAGGTPTGTYPITIAVDGNQGSGVIENDLTVSLVVQ